jgi:hypothetical protein
MAEFKNCGKGEIDRMSFYGTGIDGDHVAKALEDIKNCAKHKKGTCEKPYCLKLRQIGVLEKIDDIKCGKIPCETQKDLHEII